jgi:hypothetical protein
MGEMRAMVTQARGVERHGTMGERKRSSRLGGLLHMRLVLFVAGARDRGLGAWRTMMLMLLEVLSDSPRVYALQPWYLLRHQASEALP